MTDSSDGRVPAAQEDSSVLNDHKTGGVYRSDVGTESSGGPPRSFLGRLDINQWLTFLVGFGSLVVSYMTYRNAADTSDIKNAIGNLSELATQTKRQADATSEQLALSFPPRLNVSNFIVYQGDKTDENAAPLMEIKERISGYVWLRNFGREPATITHANCGMYWYEGPLPMLRPYDDPKFRWTPPKKWVDGTTQFVESDKFEPGETGRWEVTNYRSLD
jgi:hypothetical protein